MCLYQLCAPAKCSTKPAICVSDGGGRRRTTLRYSSSVSRSSLRRFSIHRSGSLTLAPCTHVTAWMPVSQLRCPRPHDARLGPTHAPIPDNVPYSGVLIAQQKRPLVLLSGRCRLSRQKRLVR